MALHGFVKCSDGRLYHRVLSAEALQAWDRRKEHRDLQDGKNERQRRWRERQRRLSQVLRDKGITPPQGASLETLERLARDAHVDASVDDPVDVYRDAPEMRKTGTGTGTGTVIDT